MKQCIEKREVQQLDRLLMKADHLRQLQDVVAGSIRHTLHLTSDDDPERGGVVDRFVRADVVGKMESLISELGIYVEEQV